MSQDIDLIRQTLEDARSLRKARVPYYTDALDALARLSSALEAAEADARQKEEYLQAAEAALKDIEWTGEAPTLDACRRRANQYLSGPGLERHSRALGRA